MARAAADKQGEDDRTAVEGKKTSGVVEGKAEISEPSSNKRDKPEREFISPDNRLFDRFSIIVILIGLIAFMGGLGIDLATPKYPEIIDVLDACVPERDAECQAELREFDRSAHASSEFTLLGMVAGTLQALGLTIIAAVFISSTVDRRTRSYFFRELARKTEILGSNVLLGMFESRHHPRLFSMVKEHVFEKNVLRRNIDINYTLVDLEEDFSGTRLNGERFLKVDVILSTITENINVAKTESEGVVTLPIWLGLPNPILDELKKHVRVNSFRVGERKLDPEHIQRINEDLQACLKDDTENDAPVHIDDIDLQPGQTVTVSGSYTMVKELQDTEVFRSKEIAENIHLTVVNKSTEDLAIRARSLAHGRLHHSASPSAQQWKLDELSLPLQGIMVWWKKKPNGPPGSTIADAVPISDEPDRPSQAR